MLIKLLPAKCNLPPKNYCKNLIY